MSLQARRKDRRGEFQCRACGKSLTSGGRLQHHRAAEHDPRTSEDIQRRTSVNSATDLKGLRDIRTVVSIHSRSASRHKGTPYLEVLSLGMEKLRLETELSRLTKRQGHIETRLGGITQLLGERLVQIQEDLPETDPMARESADERETKGGRSLPPNLRTMKVEY